MSSKTNPSPKGNPSCSKSEPNAESNKITSYFSALRPEGRAKMCALKAGDTKQKEILQKLKNKDSMTLRPKSEDDKSSTVEAGAKVDSPSTQSKEKLRGNISVMSALKTPLSQVLRKSIEASEGKKELSERTQSVEEKTTIQLVSEKKEVSPTEKAAEVPQARQKAKKSFTESESGMALRRSQKLSKPAASNLRSHVKRAVDINVGAGTGVKRRVTVSESGELLPSKNSSNSKTSTQSSCSSPGLTTSPSPTEDREHGSSNQSGTSSGKMKKNRKRHFRGATYGLFLSKKRKKSLLKKSQDESRDDECSLAGTENSSYLDSEDGNSLMSEDLYTPSEKSLADEEHNPDSRNSPMLVTESKTEVIGSNPETNEGSEHNEDMGDNEQMEHIEDKECKEDQEHIDDREHIEDRKHIEVEEHVEDQTQVANQESTGDGKDVIKSENETPLQNENDEASQNAADLMQQLEEMQWESDSKCDSFSANQFHSEDLKAPLYDDISNESFSNSASFPFKTSPTDNVDDENKVVKESVSEKCDSKIEDTSYPKDEEKDTTETTRISDSDDKNFSNIFENDENSNPVESSPEKNSSVLDSSGHEQDNESFVASMTTSGDENDHENQAALMSDAEMKDGDPSDGQSTIATCVKSRQRIKRRFTDDIVDTDVGLLSLNTSMAAPRKVPPKPDPPKDVIQTFVSVTHSEAKKGPIAKIECIYNSHQDPINSCTCEGETYEANLGNEDEGVFCQAVDSIDDKLVGCSNPVVTPRLVRSSVKIPFTIMCEMHLWRLKHHHSCPYCGLFCSQGYFMQCSSTKSKQRVVHLYHENCQPKEEGILPFCLHCGTTTGMKRVLLEMHMANPPSFYLSQLPSLPIPHVERAKISFSHGSEVLKKGDDELTSCAYRIEDTGKVLSSVGLNSGPEKDELDRLLQVLNEEKIVPHLYVPDELYNAASQGDVLKVLNILAQGMDPNQRFESHENETALHAAAAGGHTTVVHLLIQAGAINDSLNERIYTPLMLAVENNHKDVVFYLVKNGACADFKGENGMSSFHIAAKIGGLEILKILMSSRDVDVNSQDDGGWTPIVWASEHDHYDVVKYLLKRGANPNIKDNEGNTGLHWSAFSGSVDICYLYLDYGCDINAVNELGDTPLHIAARQDSLPCVTLLLSRGADVQLKNKAELIPAECVIDKNSDTYLSLSLNMLLKKIAVKYQHKAEKILHRDISRGKEQIAIQCVNDVDDEPPPLDFLYVTENCETTPMNIDRTITSLQSCHCDDDCSTASCTCASISYQCWYDKEGLLLPNFNLLDPPMLFECNRACSCWSLNCRNRVLQNGMTCRLQLIRTKGKGWGVRTLKDIPKGTFICEYVGEMISDSAADKRADDSYLFDLDNRDGETYCLDARYYGNISRFINHLCEPNLVPVKVYVDHQDLNFPRIAFFSSRDIKQYEELGFDYCEKFWVIKYKYFTCDCGSPKCKYSKDTIHSTLANYYKRVKEEQMEEVPAAAPESQPFS